MPSPDPLVSTVTAPAPTLRLRLRPRHVLWYQTSDHLSGGLILGMCLFSPWAFGTTEEWSTWVMNFAGYALGLFWLVKLYLRRFLNYPAARWMVDRADASWSRFLHMALFALTIAILLFTLISAVNARATYDPPSFSFVHHEAISWLPSSLDGASTWFAFWQYLGLAAFFWALRDWLSGRSGGEQRVTRRAFSPSVGPATAPALKQQEIPSARHSPRQQSNPNSQSTSAPLLPARVRALLWLLCVNGALLGIEGMIQRLEGSGRLLFLIRPVVNPGAETQFGPWAYRANAAAYFNLLWPVCLGFWWTLHRSARSRRLSHHLLLLCVAIMAACPIISTSRGGAVISLGLALVAALFLASAHILLNVPRDWTFSRWATTLVLIVAFLVGGLFLGYRLGWPALAPRMAEFEVGLEQREKMFEVARPMARDYPWFGTGPGTFGWVFQLYRGPTDAYWPAQLHNDWLETRITFGRVGTSLLIASLILVVGRWFLPGGIHGGRRLIVLIWLALAGAFAHARWDFPFQIHSLVFLLVVWCGLLSCLSRRGG
jgi:O-antigen ligase